MNILHDFLLFGIFKSLQNRLEKIYIYSEKTTTEMILYYKPVHDGEQPNVYLDFHTIHECVKHRYPESNLYRLLHKRCQIYRYQNRDLYPYEEVMNIPEIYKELKKT